MDFSQGFITLVMGGALAQAAADPTATLLERGGTTAAFGVMLYFLLKDLKTTQRELKRGQDRADRRMEQLVRALERKGVHVPEPVEDDDTDKKKGATDES